MKTFILLALLSIGRCALLQGRSSDGYSNPSANARSAASSSTSSVPGVLAVRRGDSYSSTDNILLRAEDISSILNSGNFVKLQSGNSGVTYAAIPVVRSGNTYSVLADSLSILRQSSGAPQLANVDINNGLGSAGLTPLQLGNVASSNLQVSSSGPVNSRSEHGASSIGLSITDNPVSRDSFNTAYDISKNTAGVRTDSFASSVATNSYSSSTRATAPSTVIGSHGTLAATRADSSYSSSSSTRNDNAASTSYNTETNTAGLATQANIIGGNADSISVSAPLSNDFRQVPVAPSRAITPESSNNYGLPNTRNEAAQSNTNSAAVVGNTRGSSSIVEAAAPAASASIGAAALNSAAATSARSDVISSRGDSTNSGIVRTAIVSSPGVKSGPLVLGGSRQGDSAFQRYVNVIPGEPFTDYPIYDKIPPTKFNCLEQRETYGYYADTDAGCQLFHFCYSGNKASFLCPNGTLFNQVTRVCDWWFRVDCDISSQLYSLNEDIGRISGSSSLSNSRAASAATSPISFAAPSNQARADSGNPSVQSVRGTLNNY